MAVEPESRPHDDDPVAAQLTAALEAGDVRALERPLPNDPRLARADRQDGRRVRIGNASARVPRSLITFSLSTTTSSDAVPPLPREAGEHRLLAA
jgi:hypothetical protein